MYIIIWIIFGVSDRANSLELIIAYLTRTFIRMWYSCTGHLNYLKQALKGMKNLIFYWKMWHLYRAYVGFWHSLSFP